MSKPPKLPETGKYLIPPLPTSREDDEFPNTLALVIGGVVLVLLLLLIWFLFLRSSGGSQSAEAQSAANSVNDSSAASNKSASTPEPQPQSQVNNDADVDPVDANPVDSTNEKTTQPEQKDSDSEQSSADTQPDEQDGETSGEASFSDAESDQAPDEQSSSTINIGNLSGTVEFFGVESSNGPVSFVIDCSSSMGAARRFDTARSQLVKSIRSIDSGQEFSVFLFNSFVTPFKSGKLQIPSEANKKEFEEWVRLYRPSNGTDPVPAIEAATAAGVSCIFLLSDGEFQIGDADRIIRHCKSQNVIVNTFSLGHESASLRQIAEQTGGVYTYIK